MTNGTYEETLPCGGKLKVFIDRWEISYYFRGPDLRYNGTLLTIQGSKIEEYIHAFKDNFDEYICLKAAIPAGGEFQKSGKMGMMIRVGKFAEGVCISSYHMAISSNDKLDSIISGYLYAARRAPQVQTFLKTL